MVTGRRCDLMTVNQSKGWGPRMCVCVYMYMNVWVVACGGLRLMLGIILNHSSILPYSLRQSLPVKPGIHWSSWSYYPACFGDPLPSGAVMAGESPCPLGIYMSSGYVNSILILIW